MKSTLSKLLMLTIALLLLVFAAVACNKDDTSDVTDAESSNGTKDAADSTGATNPTDSTDNGDSTTEKPDSNTPVDVIVGNEMIIFDNGVYNVNIVCADNANDVEREIYNRIRKKLQSFTGVSPAFTTDFLAYNDTGESRKAPAILIGATNYTESTETYSELNYGTGTMKFVGNKLVLAFSSLEEGDSLYIKLLSLLSNKVEGKVTLDLSPLPYSKVIDRNLASLPVFPDKEYKTIESGDDTYFLHLSDVTENDFETYKQMILNSGYTLHNTREAGNLKFATFLRDDSYLYTYFKPNSNTIRAIVGPASHLAPLPTGEAVEQIAEPTLTMVGQAYSDIGLGMIYRLPDGKFVIFDGGAKYSKDLVYKALESQAVTEDITIAAWFLTHPHLDHYGGFVEFVENHGSEVKIENLVFNFASAERYHVVEESNNSMSTLRQMLRLELRDTNFIKPHTGQILEFSGVEFEVMYTLEDYYPSDFQYLNDSSLVVRAFFGGKSILMLADATYGAGVLMIETYRDYLKSDMVQLAHHGIWASIDRLYGYIGAEVLLWPSNAAGANSWITDAAVVAALAPARDVYLPGPKTTTITFPYEFIDNKDEFIKGHTPVEGEGDEATDA